MLVVILPDSLPRRLNQLGRLQLRVKERRENLGRQVTGADIYPVVLIHFAAEETAPICSFLANNFCALDILPIINQKRAALAASKILRLMKTLRRQTAKRP